MKIGLNKRNNSADHMKIGFHTLFIIAGNYCMACFHFTLPALPRVMSMRSPYFFMFLLFSDFQTHQL